ncbi:MAG: hypothetical protein KME21_13815 [Desmonostoc vinosum HA7617-LM4]|jgi:hypothetical protein|nr:hypothetical protein [Desmonostoc vinosum HA7617-LM4]
MKKLLLGLIVFLATTNLFGSSARSQLQNIKSHKQVIKAKLVASETKRDTQLEAALRRQYPESENEEKHYSYNRVDLNGDGQPEVLVLYHSRRYCGSGGCPVLIYQKRGQSYRLITEFAGGVPVVVTKQKTNGWNDLVVPGSKSYSLLRFNRRSYFEDITVRANATISGTGFIYDGYSKPGIKF